MKKKINQETELAKVGVIASCGCLFLMIFYSIVFFIASYFIYLLLLN